MFKRKLRIKQIAMTSVGELVFTIGLGNDNKCYSWDATNMAWQPFTTIQQAAADAS